VNPKVDAHHVYKNRRLFNLKKRELIVIIFDTLNPNSPSF